MSSEDAVFLYAVGTAGCGKSAFTAGMSRYLTQRGLDVLTVNLDPGAEDIPYTVDVDVREWVRLGDVMDEYQLGPNGAQVLAADLIALKAGELKEAIEDQGADYVLLDTPGQTELFVFRESGRVLTELLAPGRSAVLFLMDPFLAKRPSAFVSQLMLSATTQFRFSAPLLNVLTKKDLLKDEEMQRIVDWAEDIERLENDLISERADQMTQLSTEITRILGAIGTYTKLTPASAVTLEGLEDVYNFAQNVFAGGDDPESGVEQHDNRQN
ncbi:MAG: ATP/GTP-binding protein [Thermoplasmatota archaeon]